MENAIRELREAEGLTQDELAAGLTRAIRAGKLFPVFCASSLRNIGVQPITHDDTTLMQFSTEVIRRVVAQRKPSCERFSMRSAGCSRQFWHSRQRRPGGIQLQAPRFIWRNFLRPRIGIATRPIRLPSF